MAATDDRLELWRELQLMHLQLTPLLHRGLVDEAGISYQDFQILHELLRRPHRVVELARSLGLERSRLSHHLGRMAARGLVTKAPAPDDRRGAIVTITTSGRRLVEKALPGHQDRVARYFAVHVTTTEAKAIRGVTTKVIGALPAFEP